MMRHAHVNGVPLSYVDEGTGDPILFVHGGISDLRAWDNIRKRIAAQCRFIAYNQRYFGTAPWPDDGRKFSAATHADDLAQFMAGLNAGPVHVVGWSYGGVITAITAVTNPSLFRSLILYEASLMTVLPADSAEGKAARYDREMMFQAAADAVKAGQAVKATRLVLEAIFQLPPGGSYNEAEPAQVMWEENARTTPLLFAGPPAPAITGQMLRELKIPTLLLEGETTAVHYRLINDQLAKCIPGARRLVLKKANHDAPAHHPLAFSAAVLEFVSGK